ncbi:MULTISPECIES: DUF3800 domain-containing protein [Cylindrospermopsis]|jgi:hypothetical protein|uniref:DUF3800 domain-containing protein n=2 Tax=Cylindrospermopsis TaxID=77021 RepID=A0A7H0F4G3_9CYAN|nr:MULTISPECIES: DUF3800 domain-containing protein [Cylindrospermopsis]QNP30929.1 DUF3800 domain-containing protein [Cylindrospermopsis curvispora GIHE-G1]UJL32327.1 DUF3800 domain-containing protein [Cylindrospermopsis raciborskii Cr2010]BAZ88911.1 hypothetical protein NIES932_03780 [Raphidiopsis curvata NIES-932]
MSELTEKISSVRHYFVDEAGDPVIFNGKGKILIGSDGCSHFFILGLLDVANTESLSQDLENLRANLLADPYFKKVPSMQPENKKTALYFHAKDDIPEVRREVFNLLQRHELKFFAVVRSKDKLLEYVRQRNQNDPGYRYQQNELYDYLTRRLFKNRLHKDDEYNICFARRGTSDRTEAFKVALESARAKFAEQWGITSTATINITANIPPNSPSLQAVDYFLWALQRLYERGEGRYVEFLWSKFALVHDIDDTKFARYGVYYTRKNPLTATKIPGI